jgi:hypothetical protein
VLYNARFKEASDVRLVGPGVRFCRVDILRHVDGAARVG